MTHQILPEDVLTQKQRDALATQDEGMTAMEAARRLGISVGGLKQRRTRGRMRLEDAGIRKAKARETSYDGGTTRSDRLSSDRALETYRSSTPRPL